MLYFVLKILKALRVRSRTLGKWGALVKQEEEEKGESEEGGHPLRFLLRRAPRSSDMARETNGGFSLLLFVNALVKKKMCKNKGGRRIKNATCNAHHCLFSEGPHNEPVACRIL